MSAITTHVLDTSRGRPAAGLTVALEAARGDDWQHIGTGTTDADGRLRTLTVAGAALPPGTYRLVFETQAYFDGAGVAAFYPRVVVEFRIADGQAHYHVPLLLNPFGYTTYRGT